MRTYETIFILHPELAGDAYTAVVDKFKGVLADQGANLLHLDEWGTRKLAYPIKKQLRGTYVMAVYEAPPTVIAEFERRMRLDDQVMKFQTVYLEKGYAPVVTDETATEAAAESAADESDEEL